MGNPQACTISGGSQLSDTAERLRQVKLATRRFLALWALEHARDRARRGDDAGAEAALADFVKHDWSALYETCDMDEG